MLLLLALAACARAGEPGGSGTGIRGEVVIGPTCPVERIESPCPPAPYAATVSVLRDALLVTTQRTGDDGRFVIPLPPGTYTLRAEPAQGGGIARQVPQPPVTVPASGYRTVTIRFDSGVR
jgi:hypothetical protein